MTERLYYQDVYLRSFHADTVSCREKDGYYEIILDKSAFFPEGGGQDGDRGVLIPEGGGQGGTGSVRVLDTAECGEDVVLICDGAMEPGTPVTGTLDWQFRFDRMQNHSGEHIVSGIIHSCYGYNNVGFHMSGDRMTIDLNGELTDRDLRQIEAKANAVVWADEPVRTDVYTEKEAENVEFRSKKELHGAIRVVTIQGADVCACCGTHVARTGQIGPIRIISHERFKGGVRMELMCGRWAYDYMTRIFEQNHEVSMLLSAKPLETGAAAKKLLDDSAMAKSRMIELLYADIDRKAKQYKGAGNVMLFMENADPVIIQKTTARVMETSGGVCFCACGNDEQGYRYAIGEAGGDLREAVRRMNSQLSGRGGGKPFFLMGTLNEKREKIETFLTDEFGNMHTEMS